MRSVLLALFALGLSACAGCEGPVQYKPLTEYTCEVGNFKVLFPGEPRWSSQGAAFSQIQLAEAFNPDMEFAVGYGDFGIGTPASADRPKIYKAMKDHLMKHYSATLLYEFTCSVEGSIGIEFGLKLSGDKGPEKIAKLRAVIVGRTLYNYGVVGNRVTANSPEARKFFDSFKIINKPGTSGVAQK